MRVKEEIQLKTRLEVGYVRRACALVERILQEVREIARPGVTTLEIDAFCEAKIMAMSAGSALKGYRGYPRGTCASINHVAAHGIPNSVPLESGDVVTIDVSIEIAGWYGDGSWSYIIGEANPDVNRLVKAAWKASLAGVEAARSGNRLGDVGSAIAKVARKYGCRVLENFVGHGIGRQIHEEPKVLPTGEEGGGVPVVPGMILTIEPILTIGSGETRTLDDGWSIATVDGAPCAQFEHTIAVFGKTTEVLTQRGSVNGSLLPLPPF